MRILRIHKGFTTNSSASSEWVPPTPDEPADSTSSVSGTTPQQNTSAPQTESGLVISPFFNSINTAKQTATQTTPTTQPSGSSTSGLFSSNSLILGGVVGGLFCIFFLEKIIKKLWKKYSGQPNDD